MVLLYLAGVVFVCFGTPDSLPQINEWNCFIPFDKLVHFLLFTPFPRSSARARRSPAPVLLPNPVLPFFAPRLLESASGAW